MSAFAHALHEMDHVAVIRYTFPLSITSSPVCLRICAVYVCIYAAVGALHMARYVKRENSPPKLGILIPCVYTLSPSVAPRPPPPPFSHCHHTVLAFLINVCPYFLSVSIFLFQRFVLTSVPKLCVCMYGYIYICICVTSLSLCLSLFSLSLSSVALSLCCACLYYAYGFLFFTFAVGCLYVCMRPRVLQL